MKSCFYNSPEIYMNGFICMFIKLLAIDIFNEIRSAKIRELFVRIGIYNVIGSGSGSGSGSGKYI